MVAPFHPDRRRYVSPWDLRRLYNNGPYEDMIADGRLTPEFLRNAHLDVPDDKGHPRCTYRQTIRFRDADGNPVALVFQYLLADGSLGGSGKRDPKVIWTGDGEVLLADTEGGLPK